MERPAHVLLYDALCAAWAAVISIVKFLVIGLPTAIGKLLIKPADEWRSLLRDMGGGIKHEAKRFWVGIPGAQDMCLCCFC